MIQALFPIGIKKDGEFFPIRDFCRVQNPKFEIDEAVDLTFTKAFNSMTTSVVIMELKSMDNQSFSVRFDVDLSKLHYIGDNLSFILPFDFPLIIFRFKNA